MFAFLKAFMVERKSFLFLYGSFTFLHVKLTGEKKKKADIYSNTLLDINMYESQMHSSRECRACELRALVSSGPVKFAVMSP